MAGTEKGARTVETLLFAKILVTMTVVTGLSLIAEYASPRLSGILAGYPHGVAIVLFFIGMEQGADFAARAAVYTLAGLAANVAFAWAYWRGLKLFRAHDMPAAPLMALAVFFAFAALFSGLSLGAPGAAALAAAFIALAGWLMRREEDVRIARDVPIGWREIALRAMAAAAIVVAITTAARLIGPHWAGLLAGFPIVTFPFLLIIHAGYGKTPVLTILKAYPTGLGSLVVYALTAAYAFPAIGVAWGTLAGFSAATAWLLAFQAIMRPRARA